MTGYLAGGSHLYSKAGKYLSPAAWPRTYKRASGKRVIAEDNKPYLDLSHCGAGACPLGYCNSAVNQAVRDAIADGSYSMLHCIEEEQLVDLLATNDPKRPGVRFARTGGEAMQVAIRIARAFTGNERVLFLANGYHGWSDTTLYGYRPEDPGVVRQPVGVCSSKDHLIERVNLSPDIAAVVIDASVEFIDVELVAACKEMGVIVIADEITAGYRGGGAGSLYTNAFLQPQISVFAKGMSNGYPMAAIIGEREVMEAAEFTWLSSTYWTDAIGPAAALATWHEFAHRGVARKLNEIAQMARLEINHVALENDIEVEFQSVGGSIQQIGLVRWSVNIPHRVDPMVLHTYTVEEGLRRGLLVSPGSFYPMYNHDHDDVNALAGLLSDVWKRALKGEPMTLEGPVARQLQVRKT